MFCVKNTESVGQLAITGAESAVIQAKSKFVKKVMEQYRGGDIDEYLEKLLKGEFNENY